MSIASLTLLFFSGMATLVGLIPCFGCVNWTAVPFSALTVVVGLIGLATDRDAAGRHRGVLAHTAAVAGGSLLVMAGTLRCLLGCCIV